MTARRVTIDYETFYSKDYSLSKMTTQEYILHPEFEVIGVGIKEYGSAPIWVPKPYVREALHDMRLNECVVDCQNTIFDGAISSWFYGINPIAWRDTMAMANTSGVSKLAGGASLAALSKFFRAKGFDLPPKGDEVVKALGKRYSDFSKAELAAYGEYCMDDCIIQEKLADYMAPLLTGLEHRWHDLVIRMYTNPEFILDQPMIEEELTRVVARRQILKDKLMQMLGVDSEMQLMGTVMSNPKLAQVLEILDVDIPMKVSPKTGKEAFAFAKTDQGMIDLLEHDNELVRCLIEARLGLKSTIEQTRCESFIRLAETGFLALPYKVSGAHTHRLGGCVVAETMITCLQSDGSVVEKSIVDVLLSDLIWDGVEFVEHEGVVFSGYQEVYEWDGITATAEHKVFTGEGADDAIGLLEASRAGTPIMEAAAPPNWEYNAGRLRAKNRQCI
jgi:hypothetical protein